MDDNLNFTKPISIYLINKVGNSSYGYPKKYVIDYSFKIKNYKNLILKCDSMYDLYLPLYFLDDIKNDLNIQGLCQFVSDSLLIDDYSITYIKTIYIEDIKDHEHFLNYYKVYKRKEKLKKNNINEYGIRFSKC